MTASRKNPWLDLVRGAAVLLVLLRHGEWALVQASGAPHAPGRAFLLNGWIGVDLFFVLSGYLIARQLIASGIGTPQFRPGRYLALRALRIVPAYLAVMLLIVGGLFPFYAIDPDALPVRIAYHLLFLQDYLPSDINVVFWSLGVEEKFYLLAPLLVAGLLKLRGVWPSILLAALFLSPAVFRTVMWQGMDGPVGYLEFFRTFRSPFHMTLEGLVAGVAIAAAEHAGLVRRHSRRGAVLLAVCALVLFVWMGSHEFMAGIGAFDAVLQPVLIAVLAGGITLGAVLLGGTAMPLAGAAAWLARLSYSLYLVHLPLIPLAAALGPGLGFWPIYLTVSFAAAILLHRIVERPFLDWKDRLSARGGSEPVRTPALA